MFVGLILVTAYSLQATAQGRDPVVQHDIQGHAPEQRMCMRFDQAWKRRARHIRRSVVDVGFLSLANVFASRPSARGCDRPLAGLPLFTA